MTVNLSKFKPGDWFKLRSGTLMRIASLEKSGAPFYPFRIDDGIVYTAEGRYMGSKEHPWDIVRIIPAERIGVLEWITDRRPTYADISENRSVLVRHSEDNFFAAHWESVRDGDRPWAHCPSWTPPTPEQPNVSDQEAEIAALYGRLRSIDGVERGPVMPPELEFHRQQLIRKRRGEV